MKSLSYNICLFYSLLLSGLACAVPIGDLAPGIGSARSTVIIPQGLLKDRDRTIQVSGSYGNPIISDDSAGNPRNQSTYFGGKVHFGKCYFKISWVCSQFGLGYMQETWLRTRDDAVDKNTRVSSVVQSTGPLVDVTLDVTPFRWMFASSPLALHPVIMAGAYYGILNSTSTLPASTADDVEKIQTVTTFGTLLGLGLKIDFGSSFYLKGGFEFEKGSLKYASTAQRESLTMSGAMGFKF